MLANLQLTADTQYIDCALFSDERIPVLKEKLKEWFDQACWRAPSLVVLDNIEKMLPAEVEVSPASSRLLAERQADLSTAHRLFPGSTCREFVCSRSQAGVSRASDHIAGYVERNDILSFVAQRGPSLRRPSHAPATIERCSEGGVCPLCACRG